MFYLMIFCVICHGANAAVTFKVPSTTFPTLASATAVAQFGDLIEIDPNITLGCGSDPRGAIVVTSLIIQTSNWSSSSSIISRAKIDCQGSGRAISIVGSSSVSASGSNISVSIFGIEFLNGYSDKGGAVSFVSNTSSSTLTFSGCIFQNNSAVINGGAILAQRTSTSNSSSLSVFIKNCVFNGNSAYLGLAVYYLMQDQDAITVNSSSFGYNVGNLGGALHMTALSSVRNISVTLHNCVFTGQYILNGSTVAIELLQNVEFSRFIVSDCTFQQNFVAGDGGGLYLLCADNCLQNFLSIERCLFEGNYASVGGALFVRMQRLLQGTISVQSSVVRRNAAAGLIGGMAFAIGLSDSAAITVDDSVFSNNRLEALNIIFIDVCIRTTVRISKCRFSDNMSTSARYRGEPLAITYMKDYAFSQLLLQDCFFLNNIGNAGGAAKFALLGSSMNCSIAISSSVFNSNIGTAASLSIFFGGSVLSSQISVQNSQFQNNTGTSEGAVQISFRNLSEDFLFVANQSSFVDNTAGYSGGGILLWSFLNMTRSKYLIHNSLFQSNRAIAGACMYIAFGKHASANAIDISWTSFLSCSNYDSPFSTGAGVNTIFLGPSDSNTIRTDHSLFVNCSSSKGAGLSYIDYGSNNNRLLLSNSALFDNIGVESGAFHAAFILGVPSGIKIEADGVTFRNNSVDETGAAISIWGYQNVNKEYTFWVRNCEFYFNKAASLTGGAIDIGFGPVERLTFKLESSYFLGNTAIQGGAVNVLHNGSVWDSCYLLSNVTFTQNSRGAINSFWTDVLGNSSFTITGASFSNNSGHFGSAMTLLAIAFNQSVIALYNSTFTENNATEFWGGAFLLDSREIFVESVVQVSNSTFFHNSAISEGGGLSLRFNSFFQSSISVVASKFAFNNAANATGGSLALLFQGTIAESTIWICRCSFLASYSNSAGGGMAITVKTGGNAFRVLINESVFENNSIVGGDGGGVMLYYGGTTVGTSTVLENCTFSNNTANSSGGLFVGYGDSFDSSFQLRGCTFSNNSAVQKFKGGGALSLVVWNSMKRFIFSAENCVVTSNTANSGGGLWFFGVDVILDSIQYIFSQCVFAGNTAIDGESIGGGAILLSTRQYTNSSLPISNNLISIDSCNFTDNLSVLGGGGAVSIFYYARSRPVNCGYSIANSRFVNNSATSTAHGGGALLLQTGVEGGSNLSAVIANCLFENNQIYDGDANLTGSNPFSSSGGALVLSMPFDQPPSENCLSCICGSQELCIPAPGCGFPNQSNYCQQSVVSINQIEDAFVPYTVESNTKMANVTFVNNEAFGKGSSGGAILIRNGQLTMTGDIEFRNNKASFSGGGMVLAGTAQLAIDHGNVRFINNTAFSQTSISSSSTGGISIVSGKVEIQVSPPLSLPANLVNGLLLVSTTAQTSQQFEAVTATQMGELDVGQGTVMEITCPEGFQSIDTSVFRLSTVVQGFPNSMLTNVLRIGCTPCPTFTYSTSQGQVIYNGSSVIIENAKCHDCPFGGNCLGNSTVLAQPNFWGVESDGEWKFTLCPSGYCCSNPEGCNPRSLVSACARGRDPSVALCGSCLEGYSRDLRGNGCTPTSECDAGKWAWPLMAVICLGFTLLMVISTRKRDRRPFLGWILPTVTFFVQNVSLLYSSAGPWPSELNVKLLSVVESFINLHFSSSSSASSSSPWSRVCAIPSLTTDTSAIALRLLIPGCVLIALGVMFICVSGIRLIRLRMDRKGDRDGLTFSEYVHNHLPKEGSGLDRFVAALFNTILIVYTTIASVTANLLHCQEVEGAGLRLFRGGSVTCYTLWQKALFVFGGVPVTLFPFVFVGIQWRSRRKYLNKRGGGEEMWKSLPTILQAVEGPYREGAWYWASVTIVRRLLVVYVAAFGGNDPSIQALLFSMLFSGFTVLQLYLKPFEYVGGNVTEIVSLLVLVVTSLCVLRTSTLMAAGIGTEFPKFQALTGVDEETLRLDIFQNILFYLPLVVAFGWGCWYAFSARMKNSNIFKIPAFFRKHERSQNMSEMHQSLLSSNND